MNEIPYVFSSSVLYSFSFVTGQKEAGYATVWPHYGQVSLSTAVKRNFVPVHAIKAYGGVKV